MNAYNLPDPRFYITGEYNPNFFVGYEESLYNQDNTGTGGSTLDISGLNLDETYVRRDGARSMTQPITSPGFYLVGEDSKIAFHEGEQYKPFTNAIYDQHNTNTYKTAGLLYDVSTNLYTVDSVAIRRILFKDDDDNIFIQQQAFTDQDKIDIVNLKQKTSLMTFDSNLNKTTIPILHANTFTTSLYNTNYLVNISSDVQAQLNTLINKTSQITNSGTITTVNGQISTNIINLFGDGSSGRQLKFFEPSGTTTQISAFTEQHRYAILDNVSDIIKMKSNIQDMSLNILDMSLNILDISQNMKSAMDTLRDDLSLNFSDVSTNQGQINDLINRTKNINSTLTTTEFLGNITTYGNICLDDGKKIFFNNDVQNYAYTNTDRDKLNTVDSRTKYTTAYQVTGQPPSTVVSGHLDTNFLTLWDGYGIPARVRFGDATEQQTAFSNTKNTLLNTVDSRTKYTTAYQVTGQPPTTVISGHVNTNFLLLDHGYGMPSRIRFGDGTIQTTAYVPPVKYYESLTFNARVVTADSNDFINNVEYNRVRETQVFLTKPHDAKWYASGHLSNTNHIIKPGRYLVQVKMEFTAIKWYRKALIYLLWNKLNQPDNGETKKIGVVLDSSSTNESKLFLEYNHVFEFPDNAGYSFALGLDYWFASAITGTSTIDGTMLVTEL
jgi:hypothetical protein